MLKETKPTTHSTNNVLHTYFSLTTRGYTSHPSHAHGHLHVHHAHFWLMHTLESCFHHYTHHCSLLTLPTSPMMATLFMPTISKITHIYHLSHPCNAHHTHLSPPSTLHTYFPIPIKPIPPTIAWPCMATQTFANVSTIPLYPS